MRNILKVLLTGTAIAQLSMLCASGGTYQLDNGTINGVVNASDGTETLDNWFGNTYTVLAGQNMITRVDFGVFTTAGQSSSVVLYRVTGAGGDPALGVTRVYTQSFTPLTGDGQNAFLQQINLTTPVIFNPGDIFLVGIMIPNVVGLSPNDVYPFLIDTATTSAGSYWDRSAPGTFNLDDLSAARLLDVPFTPGAFAPGPGHNFIRAIGTAVPEPSTFALGGLAIAAFAMLRRRAQ